MPHYWSVLLYQPRCPFGTVAGTLSCLSSFPWGFCTNVRHRAIPQGILLSLYSNNNNLLHMQFSSFKSLLDACHLMLTEEAWFEIGKYAGGIRFLPPAAQADRPHCLPRLSSPPPPRPGEVGGDMLVIYLVPSGSLCRALIPGLLFHGGWGWGGCRSGCFQGSGRSWGQLCQLVPRVGVSSGMHTLRARSSLLC